MAVVDIAAEVSKFNAAIRGASERFPDKASVIVRKVGLDALSGFVKKNPVKSGRSQNNWQVDLNGFNSNEIPHPEGAGPDPDGTIERGTGAMSKLKLGDTIWIFNNVPYIKPLEDGSSQQAPGGMVATTLSELTAQFN